jgi:hypothetical protein
MNFLLLNYVDINRAIQQRNKAKLLEEYIGMICVNYTYSSNSLIARYRSLWRVY